MVGRWWTGLVVASVLAGCGNPGMPAAARREASAPHVAPADAPGRESYTLAFADLPEAPIDDEAALLAHLARRLLASDGVVARVAAARKVVLATVTHADVVARKGVDHFELKLAVERWLVGRGGKQLVARAIAPDEETSADAPIPSEHDRGVFLLTDDGTFERREPVALPAALATAIGLRGEALHHAIAEEDGVRLQLVLGAALARSDAETRAALVRRAAHDDADALLARAALFQLGERTAALAGLQLAAVSRESLHALGVFAVEKGGVRHGVLGPDVDVPIRWEVPDARRDDEADRPAAADAGAP